MKRSVHKVHYEGDKVVKVDYLDGGSERPVASAAREAASEEEKPAEEEAPVIRRGRRSRVESVAMRHETPDEGD